MKEDASITAVVEGHLLRSREGHEVAFYKRKGDCYVAEFRDGRAEFMYAAAWFRLYGGGLRYCRDSDAAVTPLAPEMAEAIERLHRVSEACDERMLTVLGTIATAAQRCWISAMSRLRGPVSKSAKTAG